MKAVDKIGRPPKRKSERRSYRVNVKLNTEEYYLLKGKARVSGMNLSEFVREAIRRSEIKERLTPELNVYIRKLIGIANNLNQIARTANAGGYSNARGEYLHLAAGIDSLLNRITHDC